MWSKESQLYILAWIGGVAGILGVLLTIVALVHPQDYRIEWEW